MIWLKIGLQLLIGTLALLTVYIDYKWYDKRTKRFKIARNLLIVLTIVILSGSIFTTIKDHNLQEADKQYYKNKADSTATDLKIIIESGKKLNKQIEPFLEMAMEIYPNLPIEEALFELKRNYEQIKIDLEREKNTIKQFATKVEVKFTGNWNKEPYIPRLISGFQDVYYFRLLHKNKTSYIHLKPTETYDITKNNGVFQFTSKQKVNEGGLPLGRIVNFLKDYNSFVIHIPFDFMSNLKTYDIQINSIKIEFYINGNTKGIYLNSTNNFVIIKPKKFGGTSGWASIQLSFSNSDGLFGIIKDYQDAN